MNLADLLENSAKRVPNRIAIRFEGEEITYRELDGRVNAMAGGFSSLGLKSGDTCVLMMQSTLSFVTAYYALARMGVVIVPVNFLYKRHELSHIFEDSGARGFIGMAPYLDEPGKILADMPGLKIRVATGWMKVPDLPPLKRCRNPSPLSKGRAVIRIPPPSSIPRGPRGCPKGPCSPTRTWPAMP
jgi:long-chain acyl-CoA synthetase